MKKSVRIPALIMALLMLACVFSGCASKAVRAPVYNSDRQLLPIDHSGEKKNDAPAPEPALPSPSVSPAKPGGSAAPASPAPDAPSAGSALVFALSADYPPFEEVTRDGVLGVYDGIDVAVISEISSALGVDAEIIDLPFDTLFATLAGGEADVVISAVTRTDERLEQADATTSYYDATSVMIVRKDSGVTCMDDVSGSALISDQFYCGYELDESGYEYDSFESSYDALDAVSAGMYDAFIVDASVAELLVAYDDSLTIVKDFRVFTPVEYCIYVRKGETELLDGLNSVVADITDSGVLAEIILSYVY